MTRLALAALLLAGCTHSTDADVNAARQPAKDIQDQGPERHLSPVGAPASASPSSTPIPAAQHRRVYRKVSKASRSRGLSTRAVGTLQDVTCYSTGSMTASGKRPRVGMVATLDRTIPFGTRVRIDGLGVYVVEDRIGNSSDYDVYYPSESYCRDFGRRHLRVEVLR